MPRASRAGASRGRDRARGSPSTNSKNWSISFDGHVLEERLCDVTELVAGAEELLQREDLLAVIVEERSRAIARVVADRRDAIERRDGGVDEVSDREARARRQVPDALGREASQKS